MIYALHQMLGQHFIFLQKIKKPKWCPSDDLFIILVTILYTLMGHASYLIYRDGGGLNGPAWLPLSLYVLQLKLHWIFPFIFYGARSLKWVSL